MGDLKYTFILIMILNDSGELDTIFLPSSFKLQRNSNVYITFRISFKL
jgi:hypothetical protein